MTATATPPPPGPPTPTVEPPGRLGRWRLALGGGAPLYPLLVLFGLTLVDQLDKRAFSVLLPDIAKDLHLSTGSALVLVALASGAAILLAVPIGFAADRIKRVPIAVGGAVLWGAF